MNINWIQLKKAAIIFFSWRIGLIIISFFAVKYLPFKPSFPFYDSILANLSPSQFIWHWANFDGVHYITIAQKGYIGTGLIQAFFPVYPLTIRLFNFIFNNYLYTGLILSNVAFFLGIYFFLTLLKEEKIKTTFWPLVFLLFFPTSYYFGTLYSESLFFLFTVLVFILLKRKQWLAVSLFCALASGTRLVGIFLAPVVAWEFYYANSKNKQKINLYLKVIGLTLISLGGFIIFCWYLYRNFGDPFYFVSVQNSFGASRETDKLILFYQVVWRYLKMAVTVNRNNILYYSVMQELILSILALILLIWGLFKKVNKAYLFFSFSSFFLPTLTGNLSSMPRYLMLILPIYLLLAKINNKVIKTILLGISTLLLIINTALFLRGFWVS